MTRLLVVIASTRPGRVGEPVARWLVREVQEHGEFDVEVADLAELNLPMMDEPNHPRLGQYIHQHTKDWSAMVAASDAVVFVMPEYNSGFNAPLKNAIDFLCKEWAYKPLGFVSYGGMAGGVRAVQMLKQVVTNLGMVPSAATVAIPMVANSIESESFHPTDVVARSASALLDDLRDLSKALAGFRD